MKKGVFVLGELNVDLIFSGDDVTPEWNQEKLVDSFDLVLGSSSAITACCLAGLGRKVYFVGVVGDDQFGHYCIEQLEKKGVDTKYIKVDDSVKTGVTLSLSTKQNRALLTYMGAIPNLHLDHLPEDLYLLAEHIHFGSYYLQENIQQNWKEILSKAKDNKITTSFDTGWDPNNLWQTTKITELLEYTDLFIPNEEEILNIYLGSELKDIVPKLPEKRNIVVVKRGEKGAMLIEANGQILQMDAFDVDPIDTTGAGDSFNAGLIIGYLSGKKGRKLLEFANACGAIATQRIGGASDVPTEENVENFLRNQITM
jgi:sugar/nucleoside kinase (ribokinase family)